MSSHLKVQWVFQSWFFLWLLLSPAAAGNEDDEVKMFCRAAGTRKVG